MELGSCTSPLLPLPSTLAELRISLGGCHSFLASLTETPHLLFRTSMQCYAFTIPHKYAHIYYSAQVCSSAEAGL